MRGILVGIAMASIVAVTLISLRGGFADRNQTSTEPFVVAQSCPNGKCS